MLRAFSRARPVGLGALAAVLALAAPAYAQDSVVFGRRPTEVGERLRKTNQVDMDLAMSVKLNGQVVQSGNMTQQEIEESTSTVLAASGDVATKTKVVYGRMQQSGSQGGPSMTESKPIAGKTYVVERTAAGLVVSGEDGAAPPPDEVDLVQKEEKDLGKTEPLSEMMPSGPMAIGHKIEMPPEAIKAMFDDPNMTAEEVTFTLTGVRDGLAVFAVVMRISGTPNPGMTMRFDLTGEMTMRPEDSRPVSIDVSGPIKMQGLQEQPGQKVEIDGAGTMKMHGTMEYGRDG